MNNNEIFSLTDSAMESVAAGTYTLSAKETGNLRQALNFIERTNDKYGMYVMVPVTQHMLEDTLNGKQSYQQTVKDIRNQFEHQKLASPGFYFYQEILFNLEM